MNLNDRLNSAVTELRQELDHDSIPAFEPKRQVSLASAAAAVFVALVIGAGLFAFVTMTSDEAKVTVTSPSENSSAQSDDANNSEQSDDANNSEQPEEPEEEPAPTEIETAISAPEPAPADYSLPTQLTNSGPDEYIAPQPGSSAWNADDSLLLLYRTGEEIAAAHAVVDPETGETIAELAVDAIDIEQVYWHPLDPQSIIWLEENRVMSRDVLTQEDAVVAAFEQCDVLTSTRFPGPPSISGHMAVTCHLFDPTTEDLATGASLLIVDLALGTATEAELPVGDGEVEALVLSPSGDLLAQRLGRLIVITDLASGAMAELDLSNPDFAWVVLPDGSEALALASYHDTTPGTVLLARPEFVGSDFVDPIVVDVLIGPDAGDEYPPSGTHIEATVGTNESRIVATVRGPASGDSPLTGQLIIVTITGLAGAGRNDPPTVKYTTLDHEGAWMNGYWSNNTVSVNAAGTRVVWASDAGTDSTNTYILDIAGAN